MLKKAFLFLLLILLSSAVFASLDMTKTIYGPNQTFDGYISVNDTNVRLDRLINGEVKSCGSYDKKQIMLYDLLVDSGLYSGDLYSYSTSDSGASSINFIAGEKDYAFKIDDNVNDLSFDIAGNSGKIKLDVGLNGYDWQYSGKFKEWGNVINSLNYRLAYNSYVQSYDTGETENPKIDKCSDFEISFGELQNELFLRINAIAKKKVETTGILKAKIEDQECAFSDVGMDWTIVNCNVTIGIGGENSPVQKKVCVYTSGGSNEGDFLIPEVPPSTKYYFISLNPAIYENYESDFTITSNLLKSKINNYYNNKCVGLCVIPFRLYGQSNFVMSPALLLAGGGSSSIIYDLNVNSKKINLSGKDLDLSYFDDLRTPVKKGDNCKLEINFLGKTYIDYFNLSDAPIPKINIDSEFSAKNIPIIFDGSLSEGGVVSWKWDFGDNNTADGKVVKHSYGSEGNYSVTLIVKDAKDIESSTTIIIKIVSVEEVLEKELPDKINTLNDSISSFKNLRNELKDFYDDMGFDSIISSSYSGLQEITSNFSSVKNSNISQNSKDIKYLALFNEFNEISEMTPKSLSKIGSRSHINYTPSSLSEIPTYSKISGFGNLNEIKNKIYLFNQQNVKGDYDYYLINVDYLYGVNSYVYINKEFKSNSGGELVENLEDYTDVVVFSSGCSIDNLTRVIYCSSVSPNFNLRYSSLSDNISLNSGFIVPSSVYDGADVIYQYDCDSGNCDYSYCGDGKCSVFPDLGINESKEKESYYCQIDCGRRGIPWKWYLALVLVLVTGAFWINFYRGPGNFFDVTNSISYRLFHRKLFLIEKDKIILRNYIIRALRERFNEGEIRLALAKKGWTKKQLDFIFSKLKRKNI